MCVPIYKVLGNGVYNERWKIFNVDFYIKKKKKIKAMCVWNGLYRGQSYFIFHLKKNIWLGFYIYMMWVNFLWNEFYIYLHFYVMLSDKCIIAYGSVQKKIVVIHLTSKPDNLIN